MNVAALKHAVPAPLLEQYLGIWAIEETAFMQLWHHVQAMDLQAHLQTAEPKSEATVRREKSIAQIEIRGTMTKQGSSLSGSGSTVRIRQAIRAAASDSAIDGILLVFDTPGGTANGTKELADEIAAASKQKPVVGFIEDMAASAGYWAVSQTTKIFANQPAAIVGSVGTFIGLYDLSGMAAKEGIKPVVIKTGELKAAGFPGTEINEQQKAMWQGLADAIQSEFTAAVKARGLSKEQLQTVLTARSFSATEALSLGLIDGIKSYDQAVAELGRMISAKRKESRMSEEQTSGNAAVAKPVLSAAQLEAAFPGASAEWQLAQLRAGANMETAATAYVDLLRTELKAKDAKIGELNTKVETLEAQLKAKTGSTGQHGAQTEKVNAAGQAESAGGSAVARWDQALAEKIGTGMSRQKAVAALVREQPDLHKAYVAEFNATRKVAH
jgi:signal peptide peptidase SppA